MPILGRALKAELVDAIGVDALRAEIRRAAHDLSALRTAITISTRNNEAPSAATTSASPIISAAQVRALRQTLGETRKAFAARLKVSTSIVFMWETDRSSPRRGAIVEQLKTLIGKTDLANAPGSSAPTSSLPQQKRRLALSSARRAALKLQGQYLGHIRNLAPRAKAKVKALRAAKGMAPAISLAKRLGNHR